MKKKLLYGLVATAMGLTGLFGSVHVVGSILSAPSRAKISVPSSLAAESVEFKSGSGAMIHGSWILGRPEMPVIVLMHGIRADRRALFKRAEYFKKAGYSVLLFDFQAHGESDGERITFGYLESKDARAAVHFAKEKVPGAAIGVIGLSQGGAASLLGPSPVEADALVLEAVFPDIRAATGNRIQQWIGTSFSDLLTPFLLARMRARLDFGEKDLSPVDHIGQFKNPILILSGGEDRHTTLADTLALFKAANEPKQMMIFPGAAHVDLYDHDVDRYEKVVGAFFQKNLKNH